MNVVCLIGRLVQDPELKYTPSGVAVCTMRIAVDRRFKSESGEKVSDFFNLVAWRQRAEFASNYLHKGRLVAVEGTLQSRSYESQGQKRYVTEVVVDNIQGLDRAKNDSEPASVPTSDSDQQAENYDPFAEE